MAPWQKEHLMFLAIMRNCSKETRLDHKCIGILDRITVKISLVYVVILMTESKTIRLDMETHN